MNNTILLADDSVTIRKVVELTFMDESYELISVGSGTDAMDRFDGNVDLVIADVHMPGADGYEVCRQVKSESPETPVLLLVGTFEQFDESEASKAGADDYLKKPFDSQDLLARVRKLLKLSDAQVVVEPRSPADTEVHPEEPAVFAAAGDVSVSTGAAPMAERAEAVIGGAGDSKSAEGAPELSEEVIDRIARRVVELLSEDAIREVVWEVIPDLAEVVIKERLDQLESRVE